MERNLQPLNIIMGSAVVMHECWQHNNLLFYLPKSIFLPTMQDKCVKDLNVFFVADIRSDGQ